MLEGTFEWLQRLQKADIPMCICSDTDAQRFAKHPLHARVIRTGAPAQPCPCRGGDRQAGAVRLERSYMPGKVTHS